MSNLKENFKIRLKTFLEGKVFESHGFQTRGKMGGFRISIIPLDRGQDASYALQITGRARADGLLEIRVGTADKETGMEIGEQMVMESVREIDQLEWLKLDYENPRRGKKSGRKYKTKKKT